MRHLTVTPTISSSDLLLSSAWNSLLCVAISLCFMSVISLRTFSSLCVPELTWPFKSSIWSICRFLGKEKLISLEGLGHMSIPLRFQVHFSTFGIVAGRFFFFFLFCLCFFQYRGKHAHYLNWIIWKLTKKHPIWVKWVAFFKGKLVYCLMGGKIYQKNR